MKRHLALFVLATLTWYFNTPAYARLGSTLIS